MRDIHVCRAVYAIRGAWVAVLGQLIRAGMACDLSSDSQCFDVLFPPLRVAPSCLRVRARGMGPAARADACADVACTLMRRNASRRPDPPSCLFLDGRPWRRRGRGEGAWGTREGRSRRRGWRQRQRWRRRECKHWGQRGRKFRSSGRPGAAWGSRWRRRRGRSAEADGEAGTAAVGAGGSRA